MLIVHGVLITLGHAPGVIQDGAVCVQGDRIVALGHSSQLRLHYPDEPILDADGLLALPGLIDAHTHIHRMMAPSLLLTRTPGDDASRLDSIWSRFEMTQDYEWLRYSALAYCVGAIKHGITTFFAEYSGGRTTKYALDALAEPILQAGLRALLCCQVSDRISPAHAREAVEENARFGRRAQETPLLAASMGLDATTAVSNDSLRAAVGAAAVADTGFHIQVSQERSETRDCLSRYGMRPVERLRKFGALGPRTAIIHGVHLASEDMDLLRRAGAAVVHCPRSNMVQGVGVAPLAALRDKGVPTCLGSDGLAPNLWMEMQAALLLQRHGVGPSHPLGAEDLVGMAWRNSAALASRIYRTRVGELSVGALADIILLRYASPMPITADSLAEHALLGLGSAQVDTVVVAGKPLMRQGELLTIDEEAVLARCRELALQAENRT